MQYIITKINGTGRGRIELCLNENIRLFLYSGEIRKLSLQEGMELSEEEYQQILHEIIGKRATKRAMHILERQDKTEYQLREKLMQNDYPEDAIEDAISYVKHYHYLDDERYARTFIRFHQEKRSRMRLQSDLMQRGVPKDIIARCIEEEFSSDEKEQIRILLEKKGFSSDAMDRNEARKIYQFLLRRGFRSSDITTVMRRFDFDA